MHRDFYSVIPAGGAGTRLWPLSRAARPKFLLPLIGGKSLLQLTADRVAPISPPDRIYTVSGKSHIAAIARQLPDLPEENMIAEPAMRGTGSAIALAALLISQHDPRAIMGSFAADHNIGNVDAFHQALSTAIASAEAGYLTTIGIEPNRPETGYGYIERSDDLAFPGAYVARRFVEKPDLATAEQFLETGRYLWNASMFVWRVDVFLREFERAQPELFAQLETIAACWNDPSDAERSRARLARSASHDNRSGPDGIRRRVRCRSSRDGMVGYRRLEWLCRAHRRGRRRELSQWTGRGSARGQLHRLVRNQSYRRVGRPRQSSRSSIWTMRSWSSIGLRRKTSARWSPRWSGSIPT